ncbi:MAG: hypothetical protein JWQ88_179 [Rhodoferax sp.]|nr:hypothetical protein [Rhodoferax sp.]
MTISAKTLSAIQAAGQAIDAARAELVTATQDHATQVMQAIETNAFGADNDGLYDRWKAIARLSQSVQDIEVQCKAVFHAAAELAMQAGDSAAPLRKSRPALLGHGPIDLAPSDVQAKATGARVKPAKRAKPGKTSGSAASRRSNGKPGRTAAKQRPVKGNSAKVLSHLQSLLSAKKFTRVTQSEIAAAAGIPNGSIGAALRQLSGKGLLTEGEKGHYRLA